MRAVGYVRITAQEQKEGHESVSQQDAKIRKYAKKQGLELVNIYVDDPIGVLKGSPAIGDVCSRAGIINMLDEATAREWGYVVVTSRDRVKRSDLSFDPEHELNQHGKDVVEVGQELNLKKPRRKRVKPKREKLSVSQRLFKGRQAGARAGKHQSGPAPYGYKRDYSQRHTRGVLLDIHPEEAALVRQVFREYLKRKSMKRVLDWLWSKGIKTRRGKDWSRAGLSWMLKNETYLGRVRFGDIRVKGQHPAIISPIIFNKVQTLIRKNNKRGGFKAKAE